MFSVHQQMGAGPAESSDDGRKATDLRVRGVKKPTGGGSVFGVLVGSGRFDGGGDRPRRIHGPDKTRKRALHCPAQNCISPAFRCLPL